MEEGIKQENTRVYKVIIVVLAAAVVIVGALFTVRLFTSPGGFNNNGLSGAAMSDGQVVTAEDGTEVTIHQGENGEYYGVSTFGDDEDEGEGESK